VQSPPYELRGSERSADLLAVGRFGAIDRVRGRLRSSDVELQAIERRTDQRFHPFWGSLLKEENEESSFGAQVEEYACLYTSRVSNFLFYSPQQYFRSPRDEMAHELG